MADRYLPLDEEGYFHFDGRRVDDEELGAKLLNNIKPLERGVFQTDFDGVPAFLEYFDEPLIARHVRASSRPGYAEIDLPYRQKAEVLLNSLNVDEWDRFHGLTEKQIPFVFSRQAQVEFFELLDEFDDESVTVAGERYSTPSWLAPAEEPNGSGFWTNIYQTETPGWEQGRESVVLPHVLPQLKLNKCRVLVLGAGSGHDAAYFAKQGHFVTAVDFSEEAAARMEKNYPGQFRVLKSDIFKLPENLTGQFDLIFEHTLYCAISPERRNGLVKVWKRMLSPGGNLLGVFFVHQKRVGPPFGGSEWEVRERLKASFDFLFWTRWRQSIETRKARELVVYAKLK